MKLLLIGDKELTGDEIPENITAVYALEDGTTLHIQITPEQLLIDYLIPNGIHYIDSWTPEELQYNIINEPNTLRRG